MRCRVDRSAREAIKFITETSEETDHEYGFYLCEKDGKTMPHVLCIGKEACIPKEGLTDCPADHITKGFWHTHPREVNPVLSPEDIQFAWNKDAMVCAIATASGKTLCVETRNLTREQALGLNELERYIRRLAYQRTPKVGTIEEYNTIFMDNFKRTYEREFIKALKGYLDRRDASWCEVKI